ncbi:MAG TPA: hypothetical protein VF615_04725 [Longimicrobiaceae bacterium]|jgi:hypothetical protein
MSFVRKMLGHAPSALLSAGVLLIVFSSGGAMLREPDASTLALLLLTGVFTLTAAHSLFWRVRHRAEPPALLSRIRWAGIWVTVAVLLWTRFGGG